MRIILIAALLVAVTLGAACANTMYFAQDDFWLKFGTFGQPGSAGGEFFAAGTLKDWTINADLAYFEVHGFTAAGAQPVGSEWVTLYGFNTTLTVKNLVNNNIMWQGSGWLDTHVNMDGSAFAATGRPTYENEPTTYLSKGTGMFYQTFTTINWNVQTFYVPWLGTYNWGYSDRTDPDNIVAVPANLATHQSGNVQGKLVAIPESMSIILGALGLGSIGGLRRLRRK